MAVLHWGKGGDVSQSIRSTGQAKGSRGSRDAGPVQQLKYHQRYQTADYPLSMGPKRKRCGGLIVESARPQGRTVTRQGKEASCACVHHAPIHSFSQSIFSLFLTHHRTTHFPRSLEPITPSISIFVSSPLIPPFALCSVLSFVRPPAIRPSSAQRTARYGAPADSTAPRGCPGPSRPQTPHCSSQKSLGADSSDEYVFFAWK